MGIKGIGGFVVRHFMKPEDSKQESFVKSGIEKTQKQVENCGGWIIISTENDNLCPHAKRNFIDALTFRNSKSCCKTFIKIWKANER